MLFEEYRGYDAMALAEMVRKKAVSPLELLEVAIRRLEAVEPKLNSVVHRMYDEGRRMAAAAPDDAPFAGVPFLIKDLSLAVAGHPMTGGSAALRNYVPRHDTYAVQQFRKAGFIFLGKTNTPELGLTPYTESALLGPARNPWNPDYSPGGSSGGAAAAVAAGITPISTASDGGGSIRIPAAFCGIFGLKPSRGRISLGPDTGDWWSGAVVEGCVSRSVRDTAAFLDVMQGYRPGDPVRIEPPQRPFLDEVRTPPGSLRIGWSADHLLGGHIDPQCMAALSHSVKLLQSLGHQVEEVRLPWKAEALTGAFLTMVVGETAAELHRIRTLLGRPLTAADTELNTRALAGLGETLSAREFAYQRRAWNEISRQAAEFHAKYDLLLTPTVTTPPFRTGELANTPAENRLLRVLVRFSLFKLARRMGAVDQLAQKVFERIPFTPIANMTGQPSMSVPLYWTPEGMPVGVMLTAGTGEEAVLLRLAAQLEQAQPWFGRVPVLE